jgi:hypothetical protein
VAVRRGLLQGFPAGLARGDTVILAVNDSNSSKIAVQIPKE